MSHHSAQDIAALSAIPNMRVYLPSDQHQTKKLIESLLNDSKCAYVRVGRNPVEDIYAADDCPFEMEGLEVSDALFPWSPTVVCPMGSHHVAGRPSP
jgi:transketolase